MVLLYIWLAGDVVFLVKSIVQCSNELNHKIALKFSKASLPAKVISFRLRNHSFTGRLYLFWILPTKKDPRDVQSGQQQICGVFDRKN